jgi:hypothetical protein
MSQYEVEITASFSTPQLAGKFASKFAAETGYEADREGRTLTCRVHGHGTELVVREMAEGLGGTVRTEVLEDRE